MWSQQESCQVKQWKGLWNPESFKNWNILQKKKIICSSWLNLFRDNPSFYINFSLFNSICVFFFLPGYITEVCGWLVWDHLQHGSQRQRSAAGHQVHVRLSGWASRQALHHRLRRPAHLEEQLVRNGAGCFFRLEDIKKKKKKGSVLKMPSSWVKFLKINSRVKKAVCKRYRI